MSTPAGHIELERTVESIVVGARSAVGVGVARHDEQAVVAHAHRVADAPQFTHEERRARCRVVDVDGPQPLATK